MAWTTPCSQRMAEFNILYDEDAGGSYHHLYTRAFVKRFFFEIVQRRAYDGYGARNTAIRLAAQSRFKNLPPRPRPRRPRTILGRPHYGVLSRIEQRGRRCA